MAPKAGAASWVRRIIAAILAGAATTVAVAWLLALSASCRGKFQYRFLESVRGSNSTLVRMCWWEGIGVALVERCGYSDPQDHASDGLSRRQRASLAWHVRLLDGRETGSEVYVTSMGWPLHALWCSPNYKRFIRRGNSRPGVIPSDGAINLHGLSGPESFARLSEDVYVCAALPLRPVYAGFAVNTAFYAALWWLLVSGWFGLRSRLRRRRNRCAACAYDLRGLPTGRVCPECGR